MRACEESLRRLQTDHIDLYQLHRPDFDVPIDETLGALTDLVRQGKVRYIGSSTAPAWKVLEGVLVAELKGLVPFVTEQPPYNLLDRRVENELVPMALQYGLGLLPWSPLAMGVLAGRYADDDIRPTGSRASLRGGIYADRVSQAAVEAGNKFVRLARDVGIDPARLGDRLGDAPTSGHRADHRPSHGRAAGALGPRDGHGRVRRCGGRMRRDLCAGQRRRQLPQLRAMDEDADHLTGCIACHGSARTFCPVG